MARLVYRHVAVMLDAHFGKGGRLRLGGLAGPVARPAWRQPRPGEVARNQTRLSGLAFWMAWLARCAAG